MIWRDTNRSQSWDPAPRCRLLALLSSLIAASAHSGVHGHGGHEQAPGKLGAAALRAASRALAPPIYSTEEVAPPSHAFPRDPPPGGWPNYTATWLFANATSVANATCLDGSPPLFWVSPGFGDGAMKWQIHHIGGAWCSDAQGCMNWWGWANTLTFPKTMPNSNPTTASYQYFDRTSPTNSMWNWNFAVLHYCDGWSFISDAPTVQVGNQSVHFRGHAISQAIRQDLLLNKGMGHATDVVVGGCSAGGMAVMLQCDAWADSIREANPATKTRCLADSGWFPWVPPDAPNSGDGFNEAWIGGFQRMLNTANITEVLSPECIASQNASYQWLCTVATVNSFYTKTPIFVYQSQFDGFQIPVMEHCSSGYTKAPPARPPSPPTYHSARPYHFADPPYCTDDNITWQIGATTNVSRHPVT